MDLLRLLLLIRTSLRLMMTVSSYFPYRLDPMPGPSYRALQAFRAFLLDCNDGNWMGDLLYPAGKQCLAPDLRTHPHHSSLGFRIQHGWSRRVPCRTWRIRSRIWPCDSSLLL